MLNYIDETYVKQRMNFLERAAFVQNRSEYSFVYIKGDIEISVFLGRYDERDDIVITQKHYYDYSIIKSDKKRRLYASMFGIHRVFRLEQIVAKKAYRDIRKCNKMERFNIMAEYLEENMDSILKSKPPIYLRKYHQ